MVLGELVRLRPVERDDINRFVKWFNEPDVRRYIAMYLPLGYDQEEKWFERNQNMGDEQAWAIEAKPQDHDGPWVHIGSCGFHSVEWRVRAGEIGIVIGDRAYWGKGYGTDAVRTLVRFGFDTLNLNRSFLRVFADNPRAIRSYEKVGFVKEGALRQAQFHDGNYVDEHLMGMLRREWDSAAAASRGPN